jgi:hypothetical protein
MLSYYECFGKYDLPEKLAKELFDENANPLQRVDKLNKINTFVGPNGAQPPIHVIAQDIDSYCGDTASASSTGCTNKNP